MFKDLKKYIGPTSKVAAQVGVMVARGASKAVSNFAKSNPEEAKSTIIGTSAGAGIGFAIGGSIGVVGFFGGIGIPWIVLMALSGGALGNRLGIGRDKAKIDEKRREQAKRLHEILDQYEATKSKTEQKEVRKKIEVLSTHKQHRDTLINALDKANERVIILCGWATSYVVDTEFQRLLAKALKRGVSVYLGYGYQSASEPAPLKKHEIEAEENLLALKEWCADKDTDGILVVKKFPNHSKILICDDAYAVNGSFNWLSNAGRSRNIERSWLIKDKEFINAEIELILSELARHVNKRDFLKHFVPWSRH